MRANALRRLDTDGATAGAVLCVVALGLVLGGASGEGFAAHGALHLAAAGLLAVRLVAAPEIRLGRDGRIALALAASLAAYGLNQLWPLAPTVWTSLSGREAVMDGFAALGAEPPSLPLSLAPDHTRLALLGLTAPVCVFVLGLQIDWTRRAERTSISIVALGAASALLGLIQAALGPDAPFHLHAIANRGQAAGVFANVNHQATFLLMCLPFAARFVIGPSPARGGLRMARYAAVALILAGLAATGSGAAYALAVPVAGFSWAAVRPPQRVGPAAVCAGLIATLGAVCAGLALWDSADASPLSRLGVAQTLSPALEDHWRFGAGFGAFEDVYRLYEDPDLVATTYVNHAHNDYLEMVLELGFFGAVLLFAALVWWTGLAIRCWGDRRPGGGVRRVAAAAAFVPIAHSLVDYPLRTPALAVLTVACVAVMAAPRRTLRLSPE